ncbi:hypothetical protein HMI54_013048 [Coelomomyces lativittatus]|nr:hypothetical protein HMI55_002824 [Coelomomyces lativittatus]KAJ1509077.1 hypothetical protein HMI56_006972 [Coelomomyces lativittatus]KAJ1514992.1 hypothetical protein HMI54_013048 [Coelomomyces lativittatus]
MSVPPQPENWIRLRDQFDVYAKTWIPKKGTPLVATMTFVHGLGEHICRYESMFSTFQTAGIQVHAWDQRGFGQTVKKNGKKGLYGSREVIMEDVKEAILRNTVKGKPCFLAGHSMGGLIVLDFLYTQSMNIDGVIATAPALGIPRASQPSWIVKKVGKLLSYGIPSFVLKSTVNVTGLALDPKVAEDYNNDPLIHGFISLQLAAYLLERGKSLIDNSSSLAREVPLLLTHGDADPITDPSSTLAFYQSINIKDKTFKSYQGYLHELHNEPDLQEQYIQTIVNWILERSGPK